MFKKAQSAIEFIILVSFILFFFTIFFLAIQGNMSDKLREKKNLAVKEIALVVQDEINLALQSSDGYYREFELAEEVINQGYEINITEGMVYIRTSDNRHALALPIANVTGDVAKGTNIITKENGRIYIN